MEAKAFERTKKAGKEWSEDWENNEEFKEFSRRLRDLREERRLYIIAYFLRSFNTMPSYGMIQYMTDAIDYMVEHGMTIKEENEEDLWLQ